MNTPSIEDMLRKHRLETLPEVEPDAPSKLSLDVGKYRGVPVKDWPDQYLKWIVRNFKPFPRQRFVLAAAVLELKRREQSEIGTARTP